MKNINTPYTADTVANAELFNKTTATVQNLKTRLALSNIRKLTWEPKLPLMNPAVSFTKNSPGNVTKAALISIISVKVQEGFPIAKTER